MVCKGCAFGDLIVEYRRNGTITNVINTATDDVTDVLDDSGNYVYSDVDFDSFTFYLEGTWIPDWLEGEYPLTVRRAQFKRADGECGTVNDECVPLYSCILEKFQLGATSLFPRENGGWIRNVFMKPDGSEFIWTTSGPNNPVLVGVCGTPTSIIITMKIDIFDSNGVLENSLAVDGDFVITLICAPCEETSQGGG